MGAKEKNGRKIYPNCWADAQAVLIYALKPLFQICHGTCVFVKRKVDHLAKRIVDHPVVEKLGRIFWVKLVQDGSGWVMFLPVPYSWSARGLHIVAAVFRQGKG